MRGVWTSGAKSRLLSCSVRRAAALTLAACVPPPLGSSPLVSPLVAPLVAPLGSCPGPLGSSFFLLLLLLLLRTSAALMLAAAGGGGAAVARVVRCRAWW